MTQLYLDTEFNGQGGDLISMALVSPESHSWYGVRRIDLNNVDPWVWQNVIPRLNIAPHLVPLDHDFRASLHAFLLKFDNPEIICDWNADAAHFCQWLAGETYETSLDYACRITILRTPPGQPVSENPHNALADAEALMHWHQAELARPKRRPTVEELERILNSEPTGDITINPDGSISVGTG